MRARLEPRRPARTGVDRGRIRRSERDAEEDRDRPFEAEREACGERATPRRRGGGTEDCEGEDRAYGPARGSESGGETSLEQDDEQPDRTDLLERCHRQVACRRDVEEPGCDAYREKGGWTRETKTFEEWYDDKRRHE